MTAPRLRMEDPTSSAPGRVRRSAGRIASRGRRLVVQGAWVRRPAHVARLLRPEDEAIWRAILPQLSDTTRFRPPRVRDLAQSLRTDERRVRRSLKSIARRARVDEVALDHFFLRTTVAEMVTIAARLSDPPERPVPTLHRSAIILGEGTHQCRTQGGDPGTGVPGSARCNIAARRRAVAQSAAGRAVPNNDPACLATTARPEQIRSAKSS